MADTICKILNEIKHTLDPNREGLSIVAMKEFNTIVSTVLKERNATLIAYIQGYSAAYNDMDAEYFMKKIKELG